MNFDTNAAFVKNQAVGQIYS